MMSEGSWFVSFGSAAAPQASEPKDEQDSTSSEVVDPWADSKWVVDYMAGVRSLLQRTGALLGAAATAVIGGLGYAQLHSIFPIPHNVATWTKISLAFCLVAAIGGAVWLAAIFLSAQRRILIDADPAHDDDLSGEDGEIADRVRDAYARQEEAKSLRAVELRVLRFERMARAITQTNPNRAKSFKTEAQRLRAVVDLALVRAAADILENRSRRAFRGLKTAIALALAAAGIIGIFAVSDYYKGQRDRYVVIEKCAKAEAKGVVGACAAFESANQTTQRKEAENKAEEAAATKALEAFHRLSPDQQNALQRSSDCEVAIDSLPSSERPSGQARVRAVARCIATH